jgi:hypothetical protein
MLLTSLRAMKRAVCSAVLVVAWAFLYGRRAITSGQDSEEPRRVVRAVRAFFMASRWLRVDVRVESSWPDAVVHALV